jgi:hypothetical protein
MALISAPTGSILQFSDGIQSIPQIAGSPELFIKKFETGIVIGNTGSLTIPVGSTINILDGGTFSNSGIHKNIYTRIDASVNNTSSLTTHAQWDVTGSFLLVYGNADHKCILGTADTFINHVVRYQKRDNTAGNIMVSGSTVGTGTWINGQRAISSSDAYASIELIGTSQGWRIVSIYGAWT